MTPAITATPLEARIDAVARRQSARFLDHIRQAGSANPEIERDYMRSVRFLCDDIKAAIRETSQEAAHAPVAVR